MRPYTVLATAIAIAIAVVCVNAQDGNNGTNNTTQTPQETGTVNKLAGYTFSSGSDLAGLNVLDVKQQSLQDQLKLDPPGWSNAQTLYAEVSASGQRSLQSLSKGNGDLFRGEPFYELFSDYYGCADYAHAVVFDAFGRSDEFETKERIFRVEAVKKGTVFLNSWMFIIHLLEQAINKCEANENGSESWGQAWALWAGSLEGPNGTKTRGVMMYNLAQKRSEQFGTVSNETAKVNINLLKLWNEGKGQLSRKECPNVIATKNRIVSLMAVPLVQGALRYVVLTKRAVTPKSPIDELQKMHGEGLAFVRGILPLVNHCNRNDAALLQKNFCADANPPMADSVSTVSNAIYRNAGCMGITCEDLGKLDGLPSCRTSGSLKAIPNSEKSAAANKQSVQLKTATCPRGAGVALGGCRPGFPGWAIAVIVVVIVLLLLILGYVFIAKRKGMFPFSKKPIVPITPQTVQDEPFQA